MKTRNVFIFYLFCYILSNFFEPRLTLSRKRRIVNGFYAKENQFPFAVSLQKQSSNSNDSSFYHFCSGTYLTNGFILTAAHCLFDKYKNLNIIAKIGTLLTNFDDSNQYKVQYIDTLPLNM